MVGNVLRWAALAAVLLGLVILMAPTEVHVDLDGGVEDAFFACGNAAFPGVWPSGEGPGPEAACDAVNQRWRTAGIAAVGVAALLLFAGLVMRSTRAASPSGSAVREK